MKKIILCIPLITICIIPCVRTGTAGRPHPPSIPVISLTHYTSSPSSSPSSPSNSPATPSCQPASSDIKANMMPTAKICASSPCVVVVNQLDTAAACSVWSPTAFWNPLSNLCAERCERLPGSTMGRDAQGRAICLTDQQPIAAFNASSPQALASVPIACGTWLGQQESMWSQSWFTSPCSAIAMGPSLAAVPCDQSYYTDGCRITGLTWVPNCRDGPTFPCGVSVPCPNPNPCGLGSTVSANRLKTGCTNSLLYVALNTGAANESACFSWIPTALWTDDEMCISSCGNVDGVCTLDGLPVPQCSAKQEICAVPMPTNVWTGFQYAYMGRSSYTSSNSQHCYVLLSAAAPRLDLLKQRLWLNIEGLFVSPVLNATELQMFPKCIGQPSCIAEFPCANNADNVQQEACEFIPFWGWASVQGQTVLCNYLFVKNILVLIAWTILCLDGLFAAKLLAMLVPAPKDRVGNYEVLLSDQRSQPTYQTLTIFLFYVASLGLCILLAEIYLGLYAIIAVRAAADF